MSRSEEFFHGTAHAFKVGDIVEPRNHAAAFSTTSPESAEAYAGSRANKAGTLYGMIYTVKPVEEYTRQRDNIGQSNVVTARKGFKVTGLHKYVQNETLGE